MEAPNSLQPPPNGQLQRQKKSSRTNKQQQWRKGGHNNYNNNNNNKQKVRIPPQQQQKKRRSGGQTELGFFGSVPSLQDLQRENRKRTRRYYGNTNTNQQRGAFLLGCSQMPILTTKPLPPYFPIYLSHEHDNNKFQRPWLSPTGRFLAPPAPTPARFPGASPATGNPLATPMIPANQDGAADKLEAQGLHAGLDFFATNDGLVLYNDTPAPSSWTDDEEDNNGEMDDSHSFSGSEDTDGDGEEGGGGHRRRAKLRRRPAGSTLAGNGFGGTGGGSGGAHGRIIHRLRDRVAQQDAYIAELEDDNLGLRAKLHLLVHQLREIQEAGAADLEKNDETSKEHEPPAAVAAAEVTVKHGNVDDASEMNESPAVKV